jgi:tRNA/rRNA methyltransferase
MTLSGQISFILVRPKSAGNIGAAARALKNMGFADLRIVAPVVPPASRAALTMAVHARDVIENARVCKTIRDAAAGCNLVVGTTCRAGPYRSSVRPLREAAAELAVLAASNRIALMFGPEDTGLTNRELKHCERLITIPSSPAYASLNLAQAVMVTAYELRLALEAGAHPPAAAVEFAPAAEVDSALDRMKDALVAIGFLPADNPEHLMFALRELFGRSGLTAHELDILNGIASQTRWVAEGGHRTLAAKRSAGKKLR